MGKFALSFMLLASTCLAALPSRAESLLFPSATKADVLALDADQAAGKAPSMLVPFAETSDHFDLTGEVDTTELTFHVGERHATEGGNLVIAYKNAVSVLPDDAILHVEVNGRPAGDVAIASPFDFKSISLKLDAGQISSGRNTVRITARQHHRVDCSLEATYELWTRIDPARSGFEAARPVTFGGFEDLRSVGRMEDGATELRLVLPPQAKAEMLNNAVPIVQAMALYLGRRDLIVTVADQPGDGPGIDLFVGTSNSDPAEAGGMRLYAEAPYGVTVRPSTDPDRAAVIFRATGPMELTSQLMEALRGGMNAGLKEIRNDRAFGVVRVTADSEFTLKDAGIRSATFAGRLVRTHFDMVMPADFYPADYATLDLKLAAATAPGLDPGSQMLVRVNDRVVNSFPFRNTDGQSFDGKLIELPLRAFRPGVNKIEMLAELPNARDKQCAPGQRDDSKPRYVLLDNTGFSVPPLARVARLPDLSAFAGNAYPYADGKPFDIVLEKADGHAVSAALSVLSHLALSAGVPLNGRFRLDMPLANEERDVLVISVEGRTAARNDTKDGLQGIPIDNRAAGVMKSDPLPTATVPETPSLPVAQESAGDQLIRAFETSSADDAVERSWTSRLKALLGSASARFGNWLSYTEEDSSFATPENALLTIVQTSRPGDKGTLTEIRAGSSDELSRGIRRLTEDEVWRGLSGGAAIIQAKTLALVSLPPDHQRFTEVTEQSIGNYRRIAAAWLSDNFQFYVAIVILLIGLFGAWLGRIVPGKGVRTDK